ncbi:unnamed protein product [Candidula unifasciata]|uniref:Uncharacterized protein n=1 Tax=Candidula unifasciata TaxID=100452 RepID=A0A8S3ZGC1_9EUPU|nr:unnamed protein product [Candidula unifasciata]
MRTTNECCMLVAACCACITFILASSSDNAQTTSQEPLGTSREPLGASQEPLGASQEPLGTSQEPLVTKTQVPLGTTSGLKLSLDDRHRAEIKCIIYNQLSSKRCEDSVRGQTSDNDDLSKGCAKLESFKNLVASVGCTQEDYDKLHVVICTWNGKNTCINYHNMQVDKITEIEHNLSASCSKAVLKDVKSEDPSEYCVKLTNAKEGFISKQLCTSSELASLEKFACCVGEVCVLDIDISTRRGQVELAIRKTTTQCSKTIMVALSELSKPATEACPALEATKPALLTDLVCTDQDYIDLEKVVCVSEVNCSIDSTASACTTTTPDPLANEREQRDRIQKVIAEEIQEHCQSFMLEEVGKSVNDPLEKTCANFLDNRGFIVEGGQCSAEDYDKLKFVICGSTQLLFGKAVLLLASCLVILHQLLL